MSHCLTCFTSPLALAACLLCVVVCSLVWVGLFCVVCFPCFAGARGFFWIFNCEF